MRPRFALSSREALVLQADSDSDSDPAERRAQGIGECKDMVELKDLARPRVGQRAFGACGGQFSGIGSL